MKKIILYCGSLLFLISCLFTIWAISNSKMHDFKGECSMCHINTPDKKNLPRGQKLLADFSQSPLSVLLSEAKQNKGGVDNFLYNIKDNPAQKLYFVDNIDKVCDRCHTVDIQKSHPIKVRPSGDIPLMAHLDKDGLVTCTTCHDVHKEDKTSNKSELSGLLWGHVTGRAFCMLCHNRETLDATWQHQTAIPYAHSYGELVQDPYGLVLDRYSTECLSCHDGTISKFPHVQVKQGVWQHGIGESHPIGIEYPRSEAFTYAESLPKEVRLFDGRVGCLSCHEIYSKEDNMLVINNRGSRLCLTCHNK